MPSSGTSARVVEALRKNLPKLLREDVEVRGQFFAVMSEYFTTREETQAILTEIRELGQRIDAQGKRIEEQGQRIAEQGERIAEQGKRIEEQGKRIEEQGKRIEEQGKRIEVQGRRIDEHTRTLGAIGARWGMMAEASFRAAVSSLFADQPEVTVEHWRYRDDAGAVYGYAADVDMDVVVRNGRLVVLEIKSSISAGDVVVFDRRVRLYEAVTGRKPDRVIMVGAWIDEQAREVGAKLGVEMVAGVSPPVI